MSSKRVPLIAIAILLIGYAFFGRSIAYLGVGPVYIGETVLVLALVFAVTSGALVHGLSSVVVKLWVVFALLGAARTLPYVETHGVNALRDAALWGYGLFAVIVAGFHSRYRLTEGVPRLYGKCLRLFLIWAPLSLAVALMVGDRMPVFPGTDVPILNVKPGDVGVHLAGAGAFLLLGLYRTDSTRSGLTTILSQAWKWTAWGAAAVVVAIGSRGGLVAIGAAMIVLVLVRSDLRSLRIAIVVCASVAGLLVVNPEVELATSDRTISSRQLLNNVTSIARASDDPRLFGTREWRLEWWKDIVNYTVFGDYFWEGKGFGVNLADDDGYQVDGQGSLRSPHNSHMAILARMGVPGVLLWLLLQASFGFSVLRAYVRAQRQRQEWWARLDLFVLAYWTAFLVNACFDVYLEGPQAGIWFWCLFGFGIALLQEQELALTQMLPANANRARPLALPRAASVGATLQPAGGRVRPSWSVR